MDTASRPEGAPWNPQRFSREDYTREETYRLTRLPVAYASTLIPDAYRSGAFYEVEQENVFAGSWVAVGCTSQIRKPGEVIVAEVAGQSIIVTRDRKGQIRAFYNVCRHRGAMLLTENCTVRRFRCPYHSWAYDLDGRCLGTPLFDGSDIPEDQRAIFDMDGVKQFRKEDYGLLPLKVEQWAALIFVNLDPDAPSLSEWLGDLPQRLAGYRLDEWEIVREKQYQINANWKLVAENYMEYYHLPWVHPELIQVSRVKDHYRFQGPGMYAGMTTTPISQDSRSGWLSLPPVNGLNPADRTSGRFIWIFPNVSISLLPNHLFVMVVRPDGTDRTVEHTYLLVHPNSLDNMGAEKIVDQLISFWDLVNTQDVEIVERVQRGISTRAYTGGRMCFRFEEPLHRLQNILIDRMLGIHRIPPGDERDEVPVFDTDTNSSEPSNPG